MLADEQKGFQFDIMDKEPIAWQKMDERSISDPTSE